ncbi:NRDE family protein [Flavobacterium sp. J49]|uniref:NRDE family protein n=1 Tax=Flavobacterium sp. J49 TaxID=2718534 RepID=UPI0015931DC0|nr:NRDE family protein [Flavobacterium sp. J49]MBF6640411.1 NRDE family protein [Flavobacterium sp. J49]NIC01658.1 NRDE family protein [Flavobacterium sp. J49]
MCTVSFVNTNGKIIITSNRDEKLLRPNAIEPKSYRLNNKKVIFPKDNKAGGTWYAIDEHSNVLVLLNGAEEKHVLKDSYRKSRGLIVLDLIGSPSPLEAWQNIDLENIEPFTLVLFENQKLYQLRWNEWEKSSFELNTNQSHIWSSSTLYSKEIREERANWFYTFLDIKPEVNEEELFNFHRYTEEGNTEHGLVINRNDILKTLSITQTVIEKNKVAIHYNDLIAERDFSNTFISV